MVGGQILDMEGEKRPLHADEVSTVHRLKTGCLISAACCLGVIAANGSEEQLDAASRYAEGLGLAFQIRDDMLDVLGDKDKLGKDVHSDEKKTTFVTLYGVDACGEMVMQETQKAASALRIFRDSEFLVQLAESLAVRQH